MFYVCNVLRAPQPSVTVSGEMTLYTIGEDTERGTRRVGFVVSTAHGPNVQRHFYSTNFAGELHDWWAREFGQAVNDYETWAVNQGGTPNREDNQRDA